MPPGIAADALAPPLKPEGPEGGREGLEPVQERYGQRHRPPSRSEIHKVLKEAAW